MVSLLVHRRQRSFAPPDQLVQVGSEHPGALIVQQLARTQAMFIFARNARFAIKDLVDPEGCNLPRCTVARAPSREPSL